MAKSVLLPSGKLERRHFKIIPRDVDPNEFLIRNIFIYKGWTTEIQNTFIYYIIYRDFTIVIQQTFIDYIIYRDFTIGIQKTFIYYTIYRD